MDRFLSFALAGCFFIGLTAAIVFGDTPAWALYLYGIASVLTLVFYKADKDKALKGHWRIQESTLHCLELVGGWPGAMLAQSLFRHKTKKTRYLIVFWLCVFINLGALVWLHTGGGRRFLVSLIG